MKIKILLIVTILSSSILFAQKPVFKASADLNSDNILDKIELTGDASNYKLVVNGTSISGSLNVDELIGFNIIDIDKNDALKEIAVYGLAASDNEFIDIYVFRNNKIQLINKIQDNIRFTIKGNSIVYRDSWEGFWTRREKYQLNKSSHKLKKVPQFAYFVGVKDIIVEDYFTIYSDKNLTKKTATLSKKSKIRILLCDTKNSKNENDYLYLIKSKSGLIGWVKASVLIKNCSGFNFAG